MSILNKEYWGEKFSVVKALIAGGKKLAMDLSLIAVSGYSVYGAYFYETHPVVRYGLIIAASLIVLQGLFEFAKDLIRIAGQADAKPNYKHAARSRARA